MTLYLSRLTLARDPGNAALSGLLDPPGEGQAMNAHHRLLWTLFGDGPDRRRDFLWRTGGGFAGVALAAMLQRDGLADVAPSPIGWPTIR